MMINVSDCDQGVEDDQDNEDGEDDVDDEVDEDVEIERNWAESRVKGALFVPARHQIGPFLKFCRKSLNCYIAWWCWVVVDMFTWTKSSRGKYFTM